MCSLEDRRDNPSTRPPLQQMATIDLGSLNLETEVSFIFFLHYLQIFKYWLYVIRLTFQYVFVKSE